MTTIMRSPKFMGGFRDGKTVPPGNTQTAAMQRRGRVPVNSYTQTQYISQTRGGDPLLQLLGPQAYTKTSGLLLRNIACTALARQFPSWHAKPTALAAAALLAITPSEVMAHATSSANAGLPMEHLSWDPTSHLAPAIIEILGLLTLFIPAIAVAPAMAAFHTNTSDRVQRHERVQRLGIAIRSVACDKDKQGCVLQIANGRQVHITNIRYGNYSIIDEFGTSIWFDGLDGQLASDDWFYKGAWTTDHERTFAYMEYRTGGAQSDLFKTGQPCISIVCANLKAFFLRCSDHPVLAKAFWDQIVNYRLSPKGDEISWPLLGLHLTAEEVQKLYYLSPCYKGEVPARFLLHADQTAPEADASPGPAPAAPAVETTGLPNQ